MNDFFKIFFRHWIRIWYEISKKVKVCSVPLSWKVREEHSTFPFKIYFYFSRLEGLSEGSGWPSDHNHFSIVDEDILSFEAIWSMCHKSNFTNATIATEAKFGSGKLNINCKIIFYYTDKKILNILLCSFSFFCYIIEKSDEMR